MDIRPSLNYVWGVYRMEDSLGSLDEEANNCVQSFEMCIYGRKCGLQITMDRSGKKRDAIGRKKIIEKK